ncbi:xyloglucan-specific endo-beta-1 4-glucanase A [Fusarium subglutinans]|uniref:Xyloglucan-specific endo-beta-1 4-glucanase A n=1 Tax=Gibberella subglutinans TaxID=42677 RepID=A0A8H5Q0B4_GIBSU|nr:xyloglucan-specific endo-beta-1 4-glucanase A [Fusarium subglutinans]KAF5606204.1 xyloglucan-specific endo-beta-1 4-glucanase A [Fusarium subglutinans]
MRACPQLVLILSAIAAVDGAAGSNCRHGRPKNGNSIPDVSANPYLATAKDASSIIPTISTTVESAKTGQAQTAVSTEKPQVTEPTIDAGDIQPQELDTSSQNTASLSTSRQTRSTMAALKEPAKKFCGKPNESEVLFGTPWIVFSMNYNYQSIKGSSCWSVLWDIDPTVGTNLVKGYNFIGLTQGLETRLSDIKSIPSKYEWTTSKTTDYKGNVVYDFMTSDTKGDSTTSKAQELMLWLNWQGGQVTIGWGEGPIATIDGLFGKDGWKLYQGVNADTGITVSSLLCPEDGQFGDEDGGSFEGDIKDWLVALSKEGVFKSDTYVNVGNAGMEPYYGTVDFDNHLSLRINV